MCPAAVASVDRNFCLDGEPRSSRSGWKTKQCTRKYHWFLPVGFYGHLQNKYWAFIYEKWHSRHYVAWSCRYGAVIIGAPEWVQKYFSTKVISYWQRGSICWLTALGNVPKSAFREWDFDWRIVPLNWFSGNFAGSRRGMGWMQIF